MIPTINGIFDSGQLRVNLGEQNPIQIASSNPDNWITMKPKATIGKNAND
jgi:hypothetical protein